MKSLCDDGFTVLLETSGAHDISKVDPRVRRIMDLKCPTSGEVARNRFENIAHLKATDEIKFVIGTRRRLRMGQSNKSPHIKLDAICPLLFSWVHPLAPEQQNKSLKKVPAGQTPISRRELVEKIIADALPVRFQVAAAQNHLAAGTARRLNLHDVRQPETRSLQNLLRDLRIAQRAVHWPDGSWPIVWERAKGVHVWDAEGKNIWI